MKILPEPAINPIPARGQWVSANQAPASPRMRSWIAILAVWSGGLLLWLAIVAALLALAN